MVCILAQCVNGGGEPLARQPWGLLSSKDSPVIHALLASSLIAPLWGAIEIKWSLAGWLCDARHVWLYLEYMRYPGIE